MRYPTSGLRRIQGRVHEMRAAEARGERPGLELTFDEMLAHVKGHAADE